MALSGLSLSNCCSLLSPTPAIPDPLPGSSLLSAMVLRATWCALRPMVRPQAMVCPQANSCTTAVRGCGRGQLPSLSLSLNPSPLWVREGGGGVRGRPHRAKLAPLVSASLSLYIYIYIYIYIERERYIYIYIYTYIHNYNTRIMRVRTYVRTDRRYTIIHIHTRS